MRRLDWMARGCAAFVVAIGGAAPVAMAEVRQTEAPPARTAPRQSQSRVVDPLSRLHHVAQREIELGQLAQVAAARPETVVFGRELETAFRALDGRIVAFAKLVGIAETRLRQADDVDNKIALRRQADLDRLPWPAARTSIACSG